MSDAVKSRHVKQHPTSESLPQLEAGNDWVLNEDLGEWEVVMNADHPKAGEHPLPELPGPQVWHAVSSLYNPLPFKVKKSKTAKLVSAGLTVTIEVDDDSRPVLGSVENWDVVLLPRQGAPLGADQ